MTRLLAVVVGAPVFGWIMSKVAPSWVGLPLTIVVGAALGYWAKEDA